RRSCRQAGDQAGFFGCILGPARARSRAGLPPGLAAVHMLTPEERAEIEAEFPRYPTRQAVCIEAMRIVQRRRGWVSDDSLRDIAGIVGMSTAELDSVASFYNLIFRKPVGRHVIMICDSVSCWIMGYQRQCDHLRARLGINLGETTPD